MPSVRNLQIKAPALTLFHLLPLPPPNLPNLEPSSSVHTPAIIFCSTVIVIVFGCGLSGRCEEAGGRGWAHERKERKGKERKGGRGDDDQLKHNPSSVSPLQSQAQAQDQNQKIVENGYNPKYIPCKLQSRRNALTPPVLTLQPGRRRGKKTIVGFKPCCLPHQEVLKGSNGLPIHTDLLSHNRLSVCNELCSRSGKSVTQRLMIAVWRLILGCSRSDRKKVVWYRPFVFLAPPRAA